MKLYLVERCHVAEEGQYESMIVAATSEEVARNTHPCEKDGIMTPRLRNSNWYYKIGTKFYKDKTWEAPKALRVVEIGETDKYEETTVIMAAIS